MVIRLICKKRKAHRKPVSPPKISMSQHCDFVQVDIETNTLQSQKKNIQKLKMSDHGQPIRLVLNDDCMKFSRAYCIVILDILKSIGNDEDSTPSNEQLHNKCNQFLHQMLNQLLLCSQYDRKCNFYLHGLYVISASFST